MNRISFLMTFLCMIISIAICANEIDYSNCKSMQDVIARETEEISDTNPCNHDELAQLYTSRGESYLLVAQYEKAIEDFQKADYHIGHFQNIDAAMIVAFRVAFGEVVGYDNLGMQEHTQHAIRQLQAIASHVCCNDCMENRPCPEIISPSASTLNFRDMIRPCVNTKNFRDRIVTCKNKKDKQENQQQQNQDKYDDIVGPNKPPEPNWCEEVVVGVGRAMDAIACLAPHYPVKVVLIGIIEALMTRGVKCCQAGGFWKACVAPITRKWKEWKNNKENQILPNEKNLPLYKEGVV